MSGRRPPSASWRPPLAASSAPLGDRPTSTQPVNRPSEFQALSPCRSSTRFITVDSLVVPAKTPGPGTGCGSRRLPCRRCMPVPRRFPRRIATVSVHTSPLEQPGTGGAEGLNVYVVEVARRLAARGVEVDVFTRAVSRDLPPVAELAPGVLVRHLPRS